MFDRDGNRKAPPPRPEPLAVVKLYRKDSLRSTGSSAISAAKSRVSRASHVRPINHVDIFQRQSSMVSVSDRRSSVASIVRSFPAIEPEVKERKSPIPMTAQRSEERQSRAQKKREKRMQYLHYADMALGDDNEGGGGPDLGDNLLQSMCAFVEVKQEMEKRRWPPRKTIYSNVEPEVEVEIETPANIGGVQLSTKKERNFSNNVNVFNTNNNNNDYTAHDKYTHLPIRHTKHREKSKNVPSTISEAFTSSYSLNPLSSRRSSFVDFNL